MQNKDFFSGVPIEVREFLLRLLIYANRIRNQKITHLTNNQTDSLIQPYLPGSYFQFVHMCKEIFPKDFIRHQ